VGEDSTNLPAADELAHGFVGVDQLARAEG
jgi:hypothetical protein